MCLCFIALSSLALAVMAEPLIGGVSGPQKVSPEAEQAAQKAAQMLSVGNSHCASLQSARNGMFSVAQVKGVRTQVR